MIIMHIDTKLEPSFCVSYCRSASGYVVRLLHDGLDFVVFLAPDLSSTMGSTVRLVSLCIFIF